MSPKQRVILIILSIIALGMIGAAAWAVNETLRPPSTATPAGSCITPDETTVFCGPGRTNTPQADGEATLPALAPIGPDLEPQGAEAPTITPTATQPAPALSAAACPITATGGLITEMSAILQTMPSVMQIPSQAQMTAWETLIKALANGEVAQACELLIGLSYQLYLFTDTPAQGETFLLLKDGGKTGWGTYIFRQGEAAALVIEAPHAASDWNTEMEGVEMLRQTKARALLVAGTPRCANPGYSSCTGQTIVCGALEGYRESDVAHNPQTMFQAAHRALVTCENKVVALQLHGNSLESCKDLFVSNGTIYPGKLAQHLAETLAAACSDFAVDLADGEDSECAFTGGGPQSYTNGCSLTPIPDGCQTFVTRLKGAEQFLSLEQSSAARKRFGCVIHAVAEVFR